jgi:hypothetical protein
MKKRPIKNSVNHLYDIYKYPETLHRYKNVINLTAGVYDMATEEDCYWLLDAILENQSTLSGTAVQVWELSRVKGDTFNLTCFDENGENLYINEEPKFEFYFDHLQVIKKDDLICLPIEKSIY